MRMMTKRLERVFQRGQALTEFALVFPLFLFLLFSIISFGLYVFYNQQLTNAAREAARYAAVHSSTSQRPTVSRLDPIRTVEAGELFPRRRARGELAGHDGGGALEDLGHGPEPGFARRLLVRIVDPSNNYDAQPIAGNSFTDCTMNRVNPRTSPSDLVCPAPATILCARACQGRW